MYGVNQRDERLLLVTHTGGVQTTTMNVNGTHYRTIRVHEQQANMLQILDQRYLPFQLIVEDISSLSGMYTAIKDMHLRGAGLIGAAAAYGMYLAALEAPKDERFEVALHEAGDYLKSSRPTAVNLAWAVNEQLQLLKTSATVEEKIAALFENANYIADSDADCCKRIGEHGLQLIEEISKKKNGAPVNILTHCNAGWLAFVDYGSATAPIYAAFDKGIAVHVWVDETRPRNQGARLTAWELGNHGVPHTVIADNTGGHLMQHGMVDLVIVGSDRTTANGDVANKIGTYLKALAANDNHIPFYAAMPSSTIDWNMHDGLKEIPVEERGAEEVKFTEGLHEGKIIQVRTTPESSPAANYGFDITPARLVTGIITERGISPASEEGLFVLFPEKRR